MVNTYTDLEYEEVEEPQCEMCGGTGFVRKSSDPTSDDWFEDVQCPKCNIIYY